MKTDRGDQQPYILDAPEQKKINDFFYTRLKKSKKI